ncbi:hypothetical protein [Methanosphaera sp. WGK6]|uniref:hypothetical protein n=1 Tax=Methanosphaera sp. WGK6 TaxID=1561964 RepID=UPI00084C5592|nr:hypothetical protein NL43_02915 [Methanosphaera sp. WGK6]
MDEIFQEIAVPLKEDTIFFRKQSYGTDGEKIGDIKEWNNTTSAAAIEEGSAGFDGSLFEMYVPKGTMVVPMLKTSKYPQEAELLIMLNLEYKIDKLYPNNDREVTITQNISKRQ